MSIRPMLYKPSLSEVEEKLAEQVASVDEQATLQALELKKALVERNLQLNAQAAASASRHGHSSFHLQE